METGLFAVSTSIGEYTCDLIIAVSGYHLPKIPRLAERLPDSIYQIHSSTYKNPESLPAGSVLVVGTGQSGCQIAEYLHPIRDVKLKCQDYLRHNLDRVDIAANIKQNIDRVLHKYGKPCGLAIRTISHNRSKGGES